MARRSAARIRRGRRTISNKIAKLRREEGLSADQAAGKAFGMARHGDLGEAAQAAAGPERKRRSRARARRRRR